jgi:prophage antirepressor-like protein
MKEEYEMTDLIKCLEAIDNDPRIKRIREATQLLDEIRSSKRHWVSLDEIEEKLELAGHGWLDQESVGKGWNEHYELTLNKHWVKMENPITQKSEVFISKKGALRLAMRSDSESSRGIREKLAHMIPIEITFIP